MSTRVVPTSEVGEVYFSEENLHARILSETGAATAVLARLGSGEHQTHHFQNRPDAGDELLFFYSGTFKLRLKDRTSGPYLASPDSPLFVYVKSGDEASIVNAGDHDLVFFTVLAPGFQEGEIQFLP